MYSVSITATGQASAYRFLSLFNPISSENELLLTEASVVAFASSSASSDNPLLLVRTTAASAGSLQAASVINKCITTYPDSAAELRITNPTVTAGARIFSFGPPSQGLTATAYSPAQQTIEFTDQIYLLPGEGVTFLQEAAGDTDHRYNLYLHWVEQISVDLGS